jgi:hypothetical protein
MSETLGALAGEIRQRLDALPEQLDAKLDERLTDNKLEEMVRNTLTSFLDTDDGKDFVAKLRFASDDPKLKGTKYARLGLTVFDIEMLHDILNSAKVIGKSSGPSAELAQAFEAVSDAKYVPSALLKADDQRRIDEMYRQGRLSASAYREVYAAMDTAEDGFGQQLVGAQYVGDLWTGARAQSRVFSLLDSFEMTDATAYVPVEAAPPEMLFVSESTANNSSNYDTRKTGSNRVQVTAKKFVIHEMWSGEMEEDSIIPFLPFLREQALRSIAHYSDSLVLNGDTTNAGTGNINLDDADPADTKHYLAFDGIRHVGLVDNTGNSADAAGAIELADLKTQKGRMIAAAYLHDWGHPIDPEDLVYVGDPETVDAISFLDEVITVDKFGPMATVLAGQQAKVLNHPLIASIAVSKTEADGKVSTTGGNNTKGQLVTFNRRGFKVGWRRRVQTEVERIPATDQTRIVYSLRLGFGRFSPTGAASGIEAADVIYNISL